MVNKEEGLTMEMDRKSRNKRKMGRQWRWKGRVVNSGKQGRRVDNGDGKEEW